MTLSEKLKHYGLSEEEHQRALSLLNKKELTQIEWALFSSLWSEHCSYKSSKVHLKNLYSDSPRLVSEEGENAGVVDLGQGEKIAFKMESHNHPSFIEPFQGAATGVGGILRDIFAMGARPVALANYLCFGQKGSPRLKQLVDGVVSGISFYGNCVGVPNVTGQTEFRPSYATNNLVNAFALGYYGKDDKVVSAKIKTPGFDVVYAGAKTGKDGVHGASMASESFDEGSEAKRPTVQIGDPFYEKCLIESCLEVMASGLVESVQDMGAAGLTSSSFEMAVGGGYGLDLDLSKVPLRDNTMNPEEILLSESQERMLMVCDPQNTLKVKEVFSKWGLDAEVVGKVRSEKAMRLFWQGKVVCEIDPALIVEGAPRYNRPHKKLKWEGGQLGEVAFLSLNDVLSSAQGASRKALYSQYDQRVGAATLMDCSEPMGAIRLKESGRSVAISLGCRPTLMELNPVVGGWDAFLYPAIQLSIRGYQPWAVTDCLNFGNPQKEHIMSEFVSSLEALSEACEAFEAPIISGNVSLYNETEGANITSTPATAVVGLNSKVLKEGESSLPSQLQKPGSQVYVLECDQLVWSGYAGAEKGVDSWGEGSVSISEVKGFCDRLFALSAKPELLSAKVVGKFGPAYTLFQMTSKKAGFQARASKETLTTEKLYQVVVEVSDASVLAGFDNKTLIGSVTSEDKLDLGYESFSVTELHQKALSTWEASFA